ncbi:cid1 family poly A polymerase domain-containing protein [Hirsutella rhossiliensis]|uniref:Cid1 family poly A polymerase domain-containing protein n=1 Tax=Hirsutella rhossiliensis TaxID=111463 RepID=A0A9P8MSE2_9HYPO|nr:cid1 family poly A polymerase domain-containing protein [Hirsutella rhossiliensis]KAH0960294.1 cid1 family poly A polymerase domain-containing protein [Hirsutella rhossiliensis]
MDLGLLSPMSKIPPDATESPIPRLLEKAFLDAGLGARLLSRTRVPIIKLCEEPPESLRQALLAEREKWENGVENEAPEAAADEEFEHEIVSPCDGVASPKSQKKDANVPFTEFEISCGDGGGPRRFRLWQGPNLTLAAYYGLAKRLLRRAGGRDVTISNQREFTATDWAILNRVCQAFIQGLSDPLLQERVARYPSLSFQPLYNMPNDRSLLGVFTQMEGEQALQIWETWPARDELYDAQPQAEQALSAWKDVQWRRNYGVDPVQYTKDLQMALDRIKRIPSVQLILLEQGQQETPSQYFARTKGFLNGLRYGSREVSDATRLEVANRYISGVTQNDVRVFLKEVVGHSNGEVDFEAVGLGHKTFHLSRQLESALDKGTFDAGQTRDIADYIALLRSPPRRAYTGPVDYKLVIPVPPESILLILRIRDLHDIHNMASSQPRDKYRDDLEFPTSGAGVQCDINFSAHLALHNTALLRCYSHTDPRVRPMVLFVKHWAKARGINSGYRGTLSSYGYVLMVLHYLVNVVQPSNPSPVEIETTLWCRGRNIQFWRNEREILHLAGTKQLNHNAESLGNLLRGFFEYFAHTGILSSGVGKGFDWGRDVLSLRAQGGLLTKQEKGWTGAKTVFEVQSAANPQAEQAMGSGAAGHANKGQQAHPPKKGGEVKEIRHRYLFAIEDPFELDHNVARTVTHNGIVSIRDEFRRAWRIIRVAGSSAAQEDLLQDVKNLQERSNPFLQLLDEIHGSEGTWGAMA